MTASPATGTPSEEYAGNAYCLPSAEAIEAEIRPMTYDGADLKECVERILDLIRPAFEAKEREADHAAQRAISAEAARDALLFDQKTEQGRALVAMESRALSAEAKLAQAVEALEPFAKFEEMLRSWHSGKFDPPWSMNQEEWPREKPVLRRSRPVDAETSRFAELYRSDFERARTASAAARGET